MLPTAPGGSLRTCAPKCHTASCADAWPTSLASRTFILPSITTRATFLFRGSRRWSAARRLAPDSAGKRHVSGVAYLVFTAECFAPSRVFVGSPSARMRHPLSRQAAAGFMRTVFEAIPPRVTTSTREVAIGIPRALPRTMTELDAPARRPQGWSGDASSRHSPWLKSSVCLRRWSRQLRRSAPHVLPYLPNPC